MTLLTRKLKRETEIPADHHGRHIIIEIEPPQLISFREKGRRKKYTATVSWLFQQTVKQEAARLIAERKKRKNAKLLEKQTREWWFSRKENDE